MRKTLLILSIALIAISFLSVIPFQVRADVCVLEITSSPFTGISFSLNDEDKTTPYSDWVDNGTYTITFPTTTSKESIIWTFTYWDDNHSNTNPIRTIDVQGDLSLSVTYGNDFWTTIDNSTSTMATAYTQQRKLFYHNNLYWVFYSDGVNMVYQTSSDRTTWSGKQTVRGCNSGAKFSCQHNGTYFYYTYASGTGIYFRQGTLNANSTISWIASEQTVKAGSATTMSDIAIDTNGFPFISYRFNNYPYVTKSKYSNGTFVNATDFPYLLRNETRSNWDMTVLSLPSNNMMVALSSVSLKFYTYFWNGSGWNEVNFSDTLSYQGIPARISKSNGEVYLGFRTDAYALYVFKYVNDAWDDGTLLESSVSSEPTFTLDADNDRIFMIYTKTKSLRYRYLQDGDWSSEFYWCPLLNLVNVGSVQTLDDVANTDKIELVATEGASPYYVNFFTLNYVVHESLFTFTSYDLSLRVVTDIHFELTISGVSGATSATYVYCGNNGQPQKVVYASDWNYNNSNNVIRISILHSSSKTVSILWGSGASGSYLLTVHVTENMIPLFGATVSVDGENKTTNLLGDATFLVEYGSYSVTVYNGEHSETKVVDVNRDRTVGFNFNVSTRKDRGIYIFIGLPIGFVIVVAVLFFFWRRR